MPVRFVSRQNAETAHPMRTASVLSDTDIAAFFDEGLSLVTEEPVDEDRNIGVFVIRPVDGIELHDNGIAAVLDILRAGTKAFINSFCEKFSNFFFFPRSKNIFPKPLDKSVYR